MTVNYKVIGKINPRNPEAPKKYYGSINTKGSRNLRYLSEEIADRSSLNRMDVMSTVEGFLQILPKILCDGYTLDLGEFGKFTLRGKSEGVEHAEDFNSTHFTGVKVNFRPGKLFSKELKSIEYEKIAKEEEAPVE